MLRWPQGHPTRGPRPRKVWRVGTGRTNLRRLPAHGHDQVAAGRHLRPPVARASHGVLRGLLGIEGRRGQRSRSRPAAPRLRLRLLRELHRAATNAFPKRAKTLSIHGYSKIFVLFYYHHFSGEKCTRRNQGEMRVSRGFGQRTEARRSPRDDLGGAGCCDGDECAQRRPDRTEADGNVGFGIWGVRTPPSPFLSIRRKSKEEERRRGPAVQSSTPHAECVTAEVECGGGVGPRRLESVRQRVCECDGAAVGDCIHSRGP